MGILINQDTRVVVQGMTGREGKKATIEMINYGTKIVCGVTPGKGGQTVENLPVFDSVKEAKRFDPLINTSVLYVPPLMVHDAAMESMQNGVSNVVIVTENVPIKDTALLVEYAQKNNCKIIGPSSVGILTVGEGKLGSIGGANEQDMFSKGNVGIISKSGGMCAETALILTQQGIGQSTVVGIGGDVIIGSTFVDLLEEFEKDPNTKAVILYGEIGGEYEEQVAKMVQEKRFTKPVVAFIAGMFAESLTRNLALGHAGAIIENKKGGAMQKIQKLQMAGIKVAGYHHEIPDLVKQALENGNKNQYY